MENYDKLGMQIARHWYDHYSDLQELQEQALQQQIRDRFLSQCDSALCRRILLIISHQKALHLYLHDPELRRPRESSFRCFEQVNRRLSLLVG